MKISLRVCATFGISTFVATPLASQPGTSRSTRPAAHIQPATIPVSVAESMSINFGGMFGAPDYYDGVTPAGWPVALVPAKARTLGGGRLELGETRMRAAVFSFPAGTDGNNTILAMLDSAGYTKSVNNTAPVEAGFVATGRNVLNPTAFCRDSSYVIFHVSDRNRDPNTFTVFLIGGEGGRANCQLPNVRQNVRGELPITVPTLEPPKGTTLVPMGYNWGGESGTMRAMMRTTLQADSIVYHYRDQLAQSGWRVKGQSGIADGAALQRFTFREKEETWSAVLLVIEIADRREIELRFARVW